MNVRDIMTSGVAYCTPTTNLAAAVATMWEHDCGILPVVDNDMHIMGMVTDRDICIALATRNRLASEMTAGEVTGGNVFACNPEDSIQTALSTMREHRVRRLPVVDGSGALAGILSIDDVVLLARDKKNKGNSIITYADAIETQKAISARPYELPAQKQTAPEQQLNGMTHAGDFDFEE